MKERIKNLLKFPLVFIGKRDDKILNSTKWLYRLFLAAKVALFLLPRLPLRLFASRYVERVQKVIEKPKNKEVVKRLWLRCFSEKNESYKLFVSKMLFLCGVFDAEVCKTIISFAQKTHSKKIRYWSAMDISFMTFFYQDSCYDDYYLDRRELLGQIADENGFVLNPPQKRNKGKVVIMMYLVGGTLSNSATRVSQMLVNGLKPSFSSIDIVVFDSLRPKFGQGGIFTVFAREKSYPAKSQLNAIFGDDVTFHFSKERDPKRRMQTALRSLNAIAPELIIDMTDEFSPISKLYSSYYPTIYVPLRNHASSSFFWAAVGKTWKYHEINLKFRSIPDSAVCDWFFPESKARPCPPIPRENLGLSPDAFAIATIGKNEGEISDEIGLMVTEVLRKEKRLVWILTGGPAPAHFHHLYEDLFKENKIIEHGFESNLYGFCQSVDAVLRVTTTAGSGGTAIAAQAGAPIVLPNYVCDPMRWLGRDYYQFSTKEELAGEIHRLMNEPEYYKKRQKECLEKVSEALDRPDHWNRLAAILRDAAKSWETAKEKDNGLLE